MADNINDNLSNLRGKKSLGKMKDNFPKVDLKKGIEAFSRLFADKRSSNNSKSKRHKAFRDADPFSFQIVHLRLAWLFRLSVVMNVVLLITLTISMMGYFTLLPLKEVRLALLRDYADEDRIYTIEPLEQTIKGINVYMEQRAARFVKYLLEIDETTQKIRFAEVIPFMNKDFRKTWFEKHQDRIQDSLDDRLEREIIIESTHMDEQRPGEWLISVDFKEIDRRDGKILSEDFLRAYVNLTLEENTVSTDELYSNPLGIVILSMVVKTRGEG